ncbi:MAG: DNA-processing protein DprA [Victivallaceae bacterium]|nr:DNA-processing protein DprA [Victivallaceae bacterium]
MLDREACIALNMISGVGFVRYSALVRAFGSASQVPGRPAAELARVAGIGAQVADRIAAFEWEAQLAREFDLCDKAGVRVVTLCDEAYPQVLRSLYDPPLCLYVRGTLPRFPDNAVAIVGSRRMSAYGERMAVEMAAGAAGAGFTVVSGLAYGVDTVAHRAVVEHSGCTVAVLGGGLMRIHPQENVPLARRIVETNGAVISEFPMFFPVSRTSFPRRNRIVAGLCCATIVVEAGLESGALITARLALDNGRDVFAVPGHADNPQAKGCHQLIKEGAAGLVEDFTDVLNALGVGLLPLFRKGEATDPDAPEYDPKSLNDLPAEAAKLLDLLGQRDMNIEALAAATGFETGPLLSMLMRLEMKLLVEQDELGNYHRARL